MPEDTHSRVEPLHQGIIDFDRLLYGLGDAFLPRPTGRKGAQFAASKGKRGEAECPEGTRGGS